MCPVCMATVALIATGAPTTGGLTALLVKKLRAKARVAKRLHRDNRQRLRHSQPLDSVAVQRNEQVGLTAIGEEKPDRH